MTTINMTGGTVDLDNSFGLITLFASGTNINANVTINAATLANYGNQGNFLGTPNFSDMNIADAATMTVNLDNANDEWTVISSGRINYNGNATVNTFLAGADLNMNGTMSVTGDGRSNARLDIGGTVDILTAAEIFHLNGGTLGDANTLEGGTINGPGVLGLDSGRALRGHGTINADINGNGNAELIAADGLLIVNGDIVDVGTLRSNGAAAVLDLANPFDSGTTSNGITLDGGRIQGAAITLSTHSLRGNGTVLNRVVNDASLVAQGGVLVINNPLNDWDGAGDAGQLAALSGDLELHDTATFTFAGTAQANSGQTLLASGFQLAFEPTATLNLNGGTFQSTNSTNIGGAINVGAGTSHVQAPTIALQSTSATALTGDLVLDADTIIEAGATFSGGGSLVNPSASILQINNGAAIDVLVENSGTLRLGASPGQTTGLDFEQLATGIWELELGGLGLNDFDRMNLTGAAAVDGTLDLALISGYVPALGDTLNFLSATGGVSGNFGLILQPASMPTGLEFAVSNLGSILQLEAVQAVPAPSAIGLLLLAALVTVGSRQNRNCRNGRLT